MKQVFTIILIILCLGITIASADTTIPALNTNPCQDVIVTRTTPLLSFKKNSPDASRYEIQLDLSKSFDSKALRSYSINSSEEKVDAFQVPDKTPLKDKSLWWWRVRALSASGKAGKWAVSRFFVDTESDDRYSGLQRIIPVSVKAGSGSNPEYLTDYSDAGLNSQWRAAPPGPREEWIELDLGRPVTVSRAWMLSEFGNPDGWINDFHWLSSNDGTEWEPVPGGKVSNSDTYRIIQDVTPNKARFWRLVITRYTGYAPALNELMLFTPAEPEIPNVPEKPYVMVIGNQRNGYTFTRLVQRIEELIPDLKVIRIPYWKADMAMIKNLPNKPAAIILSGNNADYNNLPMFEYNGEYEIIRRADIPILGICAGCQMNAFASGYTRVHSMGWSDISAMQKPNERTIINKKIADPIFKDVRDNFVAPEVHGWAIYSLPDNYEVIARSDYIQAIRRKDKMRYGVQFHPEIKESYNQAESVLRNFLNTCLNKSK
ncbi:glutamine amidotransferase-related protein [Maridesulfovibrio sp.]|uniref:glutamine amidotransferase-related protein n=1 Tax=Maridesulfovibrio sp. TaxID=2795000 RepID=UPI002A188714|nr:discoidin domain-containing protein [Maridesulfovibrio sp.]